MSEEAADSAPMLDRPEPEGESPAPGVSFVGGALFDEARERDILYYLYYPTHVTDDVHVVFVSHGGFGSLTAIENLRHLSETLSRHEFVAINVGHLESESDAVHRHDRPEDVSFILDVLESGELPLPADLVAPLVLDAVGVTGNSSGAHTALALGGIDYEYGNFRDPRVAALAPISPAGVGQDFEAYDHGGSDNSWASIELPTYSPLGELEVDNIGKDTFVMEGWRLQPFEHYASTADHQISIIEGLVHRELGGLADSETKRFMGENIAAFFDVYLRSGETDPCAIGTLAVPDGRSVQTRRRPATQGSLVANCP